MKRNMLPLGLLLWAFSASLLARTLAPEGVELYIISPEDGAVVSSPVSVKFGLKGMGVAPAGVDRAGTGHHHLLVDAGQLPDLDKPVPSDQQHRHFGAGQTEVAIPLAPGRHSLQLLLGDMNHIPHQPAIKSGRISITVK
jgi:hypothetical protein